MEERFGGAEDLDNKRPTRARERDARRLACGAECRGRGRAGVDAGAAIAALLIGGTGDGAARDIIGAR